MGFVFFFAKKKKQIEAVAVTGSEVSVSVRGFTPVVDAHMHIQSNNCCPLTLQWSVKATKIFDKTAGIIAPSRAVQSRKEIADTARGVLGKLVTGRFGGIGVFSTEMIARIITGAAKDKDMPEDLYWVEYDTEEEFRNAGAEAAGRKAGISTLTAGTVDTLKEKFYVDAEYYYRDKEPFHMFYALPMDLSFAHYWGVAGIPIYLSVKDDLFFINDFICLNTATTDLGSRLYLRDDVLIPEESSITRPVVVHSAMSAAEDTIHLFAKRLPKDPWHGFSWTDPPKIEERPLIVFDGDQTLARQCAQKEYVHLVATAPDRENKKYEEYWKQLWFHQASAIRFPFQLISFFHYDPRRFAKSEKEIEDKANAVCGKHGFFTYRLDGNRNTLALAPHPELNDRAFIREMLKKELRTNDYVFKQLYLHPKSENSLFWGVKMYPKLGYAPDDFKQHPHLEDFYKACAENNIPITTHTSPGGMDIADPYCFERYAGGVSKERYHHGDAQQFIIDRYHNPARWEEVLKKFPALKINFAHFGGYDLWKELDSAEKLYAKGRAAAKGYEEKLFFDWICKIGELSEKYDNVYSDFSYHITPDPFLFQRTRERIAENFIFILDKFPALKDRLMLGSDWYMIEINKEEGVGSYFSRMFKLMRLVSESAGWDAWHQFAVVNPLRFLGLINDKKKSEGPFEVDIEMIKKYLGILRIYFDDEKWNKKGNFPDPSAVFEDKREVIIDFFNENKNIKDSKNILQKKELLILSEK